MQSTISEYTIYILYNILYTISEYRKGSQRNKNKNNPCIPRVHLCCKLKFVTAKTNKGGMCVGNFICVCVSEVHVVIIILLTKHIYLVKFLKQFFFFFFFTHLSKTSVFMSLLFFLSTSSQFCFSYCSL